MAELLGEADSSRFVCSMAQATRPDLKAIVVILESRHCRCKHSS